MPMTYPCGTSMQLVRGLDSPVKILREYRTGQAVSGIVGLSDNILIIVELDDDAHGSKDLLTHDLHAGFALSKDGGLDEETFGAVAFATEVTCSTLGFAGLDVSHYTLQGGKVMRLPLVNNRQTILRRIVAERLALLGNYYPRTGRQY